MALQQPRVLDLDKEQWLDKLWDSLFDGSTGGLMSPGQIRREHRDRHQVRQREMSAILEAEKDLNAIHNGTKALDDNGNLIDTPSVSHVEVHNIIEDSSIDRDRDVGLDTPAAMIRSVVKEVSIRDLERSLNLRKIAILAESEIIDSVGQPVSNLPVNIEWLLRWRESAETVFNPELQLLWARALIWEVAHPGRYTLSLMATLLQLSHDDLEMIRIVAKYAFPDFIYYASDSYFNLDVHEGMFEVMEDLGVLSFGAVNKRLVSQSRTSYELLLPCHSKGLNIIHADSAKQLQLPSLKLTRIGKQILSLCDVDADLAYLFDLARHIKKLGFEVQLGDVQYVGENPRFIKKMVL